MPHMHGFVRTKCSCEFCAVPCRHVPGGLTIADLQNLCSENKEVFDWAKEHLRALTNKPFPVLVPARQSNGHCHWYVDGRCQVHEHAPYGCAYFDSHQSEQEVAERYQAMTKARTEDLKNNGLYTRVWQYLCFLGLTDNPGSKSAMAKEYEKLRQTLTITDKCRECEE